MPSQIGLRSNPIEMIELQNQNTAQTNDVTGLINPAKTKKARTVRKTNDNKIFINVARGALAVVSIAAILVGAIVDKNIAVRVITVSAGAIGLALYTTSFIPQCNKAYRDNHSPTITV